MRRPEIGWTVSYGLLLAWLVHDLEEVLTMGRWRRKALPRLRERARVPDRVLRRVESIDEREFAVTVGVVGVMVAAASVAGHATGGRSRYFQLVLATFGLHSVGHVAGAAATRGYTPGDVTAPLVAAPFTAWAVARLKAADVWQKFSAPDIGRGTAVALLMFAGAHAVGRALTRRLQRSAYPPPPRVTDGTPTASSTPTEGSTT